MNEYRRSFSVNAGLIVTLVLLTGIGGLCWWNMRAMTRDNPQQQQRLKSLEPKIRERMALVKQSIDLRSSQGDQAAYQVVATGRGRELMEQIRDGVAQAQAEEDHLLQERSAAKEADTHRIALTLLFGGLFSLAILLMVFVLLKRELARRLEAEHELRLNRDHLAEMVDERTRELREANTHLQMAAQERGRAELALRDSEARMRGVVDTAVDGIITIDEHGIMQTVNPAAVKIFGFGREELIGRNVNMLMPEPDHRQHDQYLRNYLETGRRKIIGIGREVVGRRKDGSTFPMELSVSEVWLGPTRIFTGIVRDITDRKQAEEAVRRSEERYRIIVESATDYAIFTLDAQWRVTSWNSGAQHLLGYAEAEILGKGMGVIFTEEDRRQGVPETDIRNVQASGRTKNERWYRRKDGSRFWGVGLMMAQHDDRGNPIGYLKILQDITERKRLEEGLEQRVAERTAELKESYQTLETLNAKLSLSNRELQDFAFVASHDLQEPLRKVLAFGDILINEYGGVLGETGADYMHRMQSAATRMQALIGDLLQFSRVTSKAQPFTTVNLGQVAEGVLSDLEVRIRENGGRVEVGDLPTLEADPMQMRQLLQNLVGNAIKFSRPDAPPRVRIYAETPADPAAETEEADDRQATLYVADNGIGFDEKYLDRIFTVFQRLHGRGVYEGTGIGLAICRKIVERHRGTITARSLPGKGSTFIVMLPLRQTTRRSANDS